MILKNSCSLVLLGGSAWGEPVLYTPYVGSYEYKVGQPTEKDGSTERRTFRCFVATRSGMSGMSGPPMAINTLAAP